MTDSQERQTQAQEQYKDDQNLNVRIALHARFSTNGYGWHRWVFDYLTDLPEHARILELGCGPGDLWAGNQARIPAGWELTLTDASAGMVEAARQKLAGIGNPVTFRVIDAQSIPFGPATFDAVIANHMLYHVPDRPRALAEIRRVLGSGGRFFTATNGEDHMQELWALIEPFVPNIHNRIGTVAKSFSLENAGDQLKAAFPNVTRYDYEDALKVTEVQPLVAYLRSTSTMAQFTLEPSQWATVRRTVAATIDAKGSFHITKVSGMFIAQS